MYMWKYWNIFVSYIFGISFFENNLQIFKDGGRLNMFLDMGIFYLMKMFEFSRYVFNPTGNF